MRSTSRTNRIAAAAVATVATALATAGGASAETYCVAAPACSGIPVADVQTALTTAAKTATADRIEVGPGTFDTSDGFVYAGAGATNTVELVGAGREQTELRSASAVNGQPAVMLHASAPSRISDLTITSGDPPNPQFVTTGLRIFGTAERIKVHGGARSNGVELLKDSTLTSSKVSIPSNFFAVMTDHPGASVSNSSIDAPTGYGVEADGIGSLTVSHSSVNANVGVTAYAGGVKIDNSLVLARNIGLFAADDGTTGGTLDATNVTVVGTDSSVTGAQSAGSNPGVSTQLTVVNSAIGQTTRPLSRFDGNGGGASLIVKHSAYDHATLFDQGTGSIDQSSSNLDLKSLGFVDPAVDDYHLTGDSPLRDAGDPAPPGGLAATDLGKNPRSVAATATGRRRPTSARSSSSRRPRPQPRPRSRRPLRRSLLRTSRPSSHPRNSRTGGSRSDARHDAAPPSGSRCRRPRPSGSRSHTARGRPEPSSAHRARASTGSCSAAASGAGHCDRAATPRGSSPSTRPAGGQRRGRCASPS